MDKIRFKKRSGIIRYETVFDFWYMYVNNVKIENFYIEKEQNSFYYVIVDVRKDYANKVIFELIFLSLYNAKRALLEFVYSSLCD